MTVTVTETVAVIVTLIVTTVTVTVTVTVTEYLFWQTMTMTVISDHFNDGIPTFVVWDRGRKPLTNSAPEDDLPLYHIPCT